MLTTLLMWSLLGFIVMYVAVKPFRRTVNLLLLPGLEFKLVEAHEFKRFTKDSAWMLRTSIIPSPWLTESAVLTSHVSIVGMPMAYCVVWPGKEIYYVNKKWCDYYLK